MGLVLAGWAFGSFLYFKIALDFAFYQGVSIVAALLCGILTAICIFLVTGSYAQRLLPYNWSPGTVPVSFSTVVRRTVAPMLIAVLCLTVAVRLVIFGFSKDLSDAIELYGYRSKLRGDYFELIAVTMLPLLAHYLMVTWGTHFGANKGRA